MINLFNRPESTQPGMMIQYIRPKYFSKTLPSIKICIGFKPDYASDIYRRERVGNDNI